MNDLISKLKKLARQVRYALPSRLPQGVSEFDTWADSIINTYDLPTSDRDSILFALSTMIMHLGPSDAYKPKLYFAIAIRAGAAKQVASSHFQAIKVRQREAEQAAKAAAMQAEALEAATRRLLDVGKEADNGSSTN